MRSSVDHDELGRWFVQEVLPLEGELVGYLRRKWHDRSDVADLTQETYARVYEAARTERPLKVKAFLFATARNLMIDRLRRAAVISIESVADIDEVLVLASGPDPEHEVSTRQELRMLQAALDDLPERARRIVWMKKVEGFSQREIAEQLGVSEVIVEHHVVRAVRALVDAIYSRHRGGTIAGHRQRVRTGHGRK